MNRRDDVNASLEDVNPFANGSATSGSKFRLPNFGFGQKHDATVDIPLDSRNCLPCGHLYGLSCITTWLQRSNSQKCPQCNEFCQLEDVRRLYGMQPAISGAEALQQKVKCLEEKCASLELKDANWLRKETEWQKREAELQEQLNKHKEVNYLSFNSYSEWLLATASSDTTVGLFDTRKLDSPLHVLSSHTYVPLV